MAQSVIAIVNDALVRIGQPTITSLTDGTRKANIANALYALKRDEVLSEHKWNEATKRASLAQLAAAPAHGYDYAYQLPADFIALTRIVNGGEYRLEVAASGRVLVTNLAEVKIVYVGRIEDPTIFSPQLGRCIAIKLAAAMAGALTGSETLGARLTEEYSYALAEARFLDSQQSPPEDRVAGSTWLAGREGAEPSFDSEED